MFEVFEDAARRCVVLAQDNARLLRHNYIGTEHLLLGLSHQDGEAAEVLSGLGAGLERLRAVIEEMIGPGAVAPTGHIPFTPRAKMCLELALREAQERGHATITPLHLLLGILREGDGVACQALATFADDAVPRLREGASARLTDEDGDAAGTG